MPWTWPIAVSPVRTVCSMSPHDRHTSGRPIMIANARCEPGTSARRGSATTDTACATQLPVIVRIRAAAGGSVMGG
jgi:hypothetical protein